jgi:hypothetical protein
MAHFAELNENNVVKQVVVVNNAELLDDEGNEVEMKGRQFCFDLFGEGNWLQTSYNQNKRGGFAAKGWIYDEVADVFYAPAPFPSWVLQSDYTWAAPVERPVDRPGHDWRWNETLKNWVEVELRPAE